MEIMNDMVGQFLKAPPWMWILIALTLLSVAWRKSQWPNRYLVAANFVLCMGGFITLYWDSEQYRVFYRPRASVVLHALLLWLGNEVFHEGIVSKLQTYFRVKFPVDTSLPPPTPPIGPPQAIVILETPPTSIKTLTTPPNEKSSP